MSSGGRGGRGGGRSQARGNGGRRRNRSKGEREDTPTLQLYKPGQRAGRSRDGSPPGGASSRGESPNINNGSARRRASWTNAAASSSSPGATTDTMPLAQDQYVQRLARLRNDRPRQRELLVQQKLMNPDGPMRLQDAVKLKGICTDMCPEFERVRRIVEDDVKPPECTPETEHLGRKNRIPDENRMVKAYTRSAAGMEVELVTDIRTPETCLRTISYMVDRLDGENFEYLYGWIWDRTRAVRKDLRTAAVQTPAEIAVYLECFEQCARLLLLCPHYMSTSSSADYNHQQDIEQFGQAAYSLKERYDDNRGIKVPSPNEAEFLAYRLIVNLLARDNFIEGEMYHHLREPLQSNAQIQTAKEIYDAGKTIIYEKPREFLVAVQNWKTFWNLVKSPNVSFLMACAAETVFNRVRHVVLDTLRRAYRLGNGNRTVRMEDWTPAELTGVLGLDTELQTKEFCELYGFTFGQINGGVPFLNVNSIPYAGKSLEKPAGVSPQIFSKSIVESKRNGQALSAVIKDTEEAAKLGLFPRDTSQVKPNLSATNSGLGSFQNIPFGFRPPAETTIEKTTDRLNPFANAFKPVAAANAASNVNGANPFQASSRVSASSADPFGTPLGFFNQTGKTTPTPNAGASTPLNGMGSTPIQPGLFNVSKDPIRFSPASTPPSSFTGFNSGNSFAARAPGPNKDNPFANIAKPNATTQTDFFASAAATPSLAPGNFFAAPIVPPSANSISFPTIGSESSSSQDPNQPDRRGWGSTIPTPQRSSLQTTSSSLDHQQKVADEHHKALEARQQKSREEERKAQEDQQRKIEEEIRLEAVQRQFVEAEQHRVQTEHIRQAQEAEQRRIQEQERLTAEEQHRKFRDEQERVAKEEEKFQAQKDQESSSLHALATTLFHDPQDGVLSHFIEHQVSYYAQYRFDAIQSERHKERIYEFELRRRHNIIRSVLTIWVRKVEKNKRKRKAAELRTWRKQYQDAVKAKAMEEAAESAVLDSPSTVDHPTGEVNTFKKPTAPASAQKAAEELQVEPKPKLKPKSKLSRQTPQTMGASVGGGPSGVQLLMGTTLPEPAYSEEYQEAKRQRDLRQGQDETQTDYFVIRASGRDPMKHGRKRSFGSSSGDEPEIASKKPAFRSKMSSIIARARRSTSSTRRGFVEPKTNEELFARIQAAKQAGKQKRDKYASSSPQSAGRASLSRRASLIIENGHKLLADTPNVQPELSRSVPDSGLRQSAFSKSLGNVISQDGPAYRNRVSHFVPKHLYGKGVDAIREYRQQLSGNDSVHSKPLALSSPMPTQQSYVPGAYDPMDLSSGYETESNVPDDRVTSEEELVSTADSIDPLNEDHSPYFDDMLYDESDRDEKESYEQNAQMLAGNTQDDAIELSD
ncbi:SAC3/GANP/Nin1/mts3/eIF-3 p25 family-domain-containing protein [Massariosphaeria phaeospora]|uniref:SAC3/GANP/Nin1/mts3/eIF-3 p25 family-domain-containing protein n=1 Tax=Massariosphaeria phaeospora TaxID=100035 RepID=A0A7C8I967_9PLEO|nr:SAC3/GANP/Nin1/mts3/eIF-3 p25 family-domain-containing protein [Massariosphaeria phaeospora]